MKRIALAAVLLLVTGGATAWYFNQKEIPLSGYQGYVEGNLIQMGPEESGRIERLLVEAGDHVSDGQLLFSIEATAQIAQVEEAQARLGQAKAQLENLRAAGQRPEQIAILDATRERAQAAFELARGDLERQKILFDRGYSSRARLDQAEAAFDRDKAALEEVQRQITAARLSARTSEIAAGEAAVRVAKANLEQARTRLIKRRVSSPANARVQDVHYRTGEVVNAGYPVLTLLPPAHLKIRFYVPEPVLATLSLGQTVDVACGSCPEDLRARVVFVSQQAEFTPPVIFSEQERSKLVFRAEARPLLSEVALPIGLPVTVRLLDASPVASIRP
jgi:HlyD family secretion protein